MGLLDKLSNFLSSKRRDVNVLVVGLDNSGKTSIINHLKPNDSKLQTIVPTVGFNVEKFSAKALNFTTFDMSGQGKYRNLWEHYYKDVDAIIFVIDSSDRMRIVVSKEELISMITHQELKNRNIPVLFFANKMDVRGALSAEEIGEELELNRIRNKRWQIFGSNALTGEGVAEGIDWLSQLIKAET